MEIVKACKLMRGRFADGLVAALFALNRPF
jgi:hypothetical protein